MTYTKSVETVSPPVDKAVREAAKLAEKLMAVIKTAADQNEAVALVENRSTRLARLIRKSVSLLADILDMLDLLDTAVSGICSFVPVLR
ncbi:MAG: hypothetical protein AAGG09_04450 [Pseudomonadota bacterium]